MDYDSIDYLEVVFASEADREAAKKVLTFSAITSTPGALLDPKHWDKESVASALEPLGLQFTIPDEGFKWDEFGDDGPTLG
jgi:hypothetical protein